ncbi:CDP-alcohol phosphatidyltransferase family protein [Catalinimonas niigatensis]|uniref:CDP-alcohol phosphatidyltransferase family protein n=1 Tax=Catalinimonas niigatensis TaxID=1397264 RepID=UPI002665EF65|nr:CDP-alcohol phosphatidyltransferase family protein [Catalinimonas niigatensis]WPP51643.1 CDP-alcohol phosphatidyltransferase family protein [Catalinimonas niigatensis]
MQVNSTVQQMHHTFFSQWPRYFALTSLLFVSIYLYFDSPLIFSALWGIFFFYFLYQGRLFWKPLGVLGGIANNITAVRVLGMLLLLTFQPYFHYYAFFVLGILILIADGLDGYYARKYHTVSEFGDFFDKETDAFFVLAFCVILIEQGLIGKWVLLPGLMRYAFVLILYLFNIEHISLGKSFRRQFLGMWFMGTIMACFVLPTPIYTAGMIFATTMLAYSFMKDIFLMIRQRSHQG